MFGVGKIHFILILKKVSYLSKAAFIWSKLQFKQYDCGIEQTKNVYSVFYFNIFKFTPVFIVTWSFINYSNVLIGCSRNIYNYYLLSPSETVVLLNIFAETVIHVSRILCWIESEKEK